MKTRKHTRVFVGGLLLIAGLFGRSALAQVSSGSHPLDDLKPGHWYHVPNSKLSAVLPSPLPPGGGPGSIIEAWSSGAYDTRRNRLIVTGGGHNDYGGNELYAFDIATLKWSRIWGPSPNIPPVAGPCRETYPDGNPPSRHTYDGVEYLPNVDRLWLQGGNNYCGSGGATVATWHFDFTPLTWGRKSDHPATYDQQVSGYDSVSGKVYTAAPCGVCGLYEYDPVTGAYTRRGTEPVDGGMVGVVDPKRRKFIAFGVGKMWSFDLTTFKREAVVTTGDTVIVGCYWPGVEYDLVVDRLLAWCGGNSTYSLNLDTKVWTRNPPAATNTVTPTPPTRHGTYGRWRYMPRWNAYVVVNSIDQDVYFYRLTERAPAPTPVPVPSPVPSPIPSPVPTPVPSPVPTPIPKPRSAPTPVPIPSPTGQINITPGIFVALAGPAGPPVGISSNGNKHTTWAHNPLNGRLYSIGGDFASPSSYRQDQYSLSIAERWADRGNRNAGWRLEYPYCGPDGGVQPKSLDFVGWTWDSIRKGFWMVPGLSVVPVVAVCPDRTVSKADDPKYKFNHLMMFDPAPPDLTKRWSDWGPIPYDAEQWQAVHDPATDTIIKFSGDGNRAAARVFDVKARTWTDYPYGPVALGMTVRLWGALAPDFDKRLIYSVDGPAGKLMAWDIDRRILRDFGAVPDGPISANNALVIWDSVNKVLLLWHSETSRLHVYHPATKRWETPPIVTDPPGLVPQVRHAIVFDPQQNVMAFLGQNDENPRHNFIWFYRYAAGSAGAGPAPGPRP